MGGPTLIATGRRVLLTGGLGGIGRVAATGLVSAGASVAVNDIRPAEEAVDILAEMIPARAVPYLKGDGSTTVGAETIIQQACQQLGALTDVVLLAGVVHSAGLLDQSPADICEIMRVNVLAATVTAQAAVRSWIADGAPGNLVFVSSWVQDVPWPGIAPYAASKAAMRATARSFAREFARFGVRANVLAPGIVEVGMARRQWETEPGYRDRARRAIPLGYLQPAASVADALVFLCSPMSAYMTGATLLVDGGASLYPLGPDEVPREGLGGAGD